MCNHYDKNWQVKYDDSEEKIIIYVKHPPKFGGICPLAELSCGGPDDVGYENDMKRAKWMAAAPDLLEACKLVNNDMDGQFKSSYVRRTTLNKVKQAVVKAEN